MPWGVGGSAPAATGDGTDWLGLALSGGQGLTGGIAGAIANFNNQRRQAQQIQQQQQLTRDQSNQDIASKESTLDPFRQQMSQANDLTALDRLERASYTPVSLSADPKYAASVPHLFGGASYTKSPELIAAAAALKRNILGGNVAPTMTDPTNYGKSAALNLLSIAADGKDPGSISGAGGAPRDPGAYLTGVPNRTAGGIGTAETRGTDVSVDSAAQILDKAIRQTLGRPPNPGEIEQMLRGQGLKPGGRWVGNGGLMSLLQSIANQGHTTTAQPSYTGRG